LSDDTEQLTGVKEREQFLGFERRESTEPAAEEPKTYGPGDAGITEAANDLTRSRGHGTETPIDKSEYIEKETASGKKYSVSSEQAAKDLSQYHREQAEAAALPDLANLQQEVDLARAVWGPDGRQKIDPQVIQDALQAGQQSPQAEAPQPESSEIGEQPASGLSPKIQAALADPEIRAFAEQQLSQIAAAEKSYVDGLANHAAMTTAYLLADIEAASPVPS
jgi:hypothetical protein